MEPKRKVTQEEYDEALESHRVFTEMAGGGLRMEFENCDLVGILMHRGANLTSANFVNCDLQGNHFQDLMAVNVDFRGSNLSHTQFYSCNLHHANLSGVNLDGAKIVDGTYTEARLKFSSMNATSFLCTNLTQAKLGGVRGQGAVFQECDATYASFSSSTWIDGFMPGCKFKTANFGGATFQNVDFCGSDFRGSTINSDNVFLACDMWDVQGNNDVIRTYQLPDWTVVVCRDRIQIGCQNHPIQDWMGFDDKALRKMSGRAPRWWSIYKSLVMQLAKLPES